MQFVAGLCGGGNHLSLRDLVVELLGPVDSELEPVQRLLSLVLRLADDIRHDDRLRSLGQGDRDLRIMGQCGARVDTEGQQRSLGNIHGICVIAVRRPLDIVEAGPFQRLDRILAICAAGVEYIGGNSGLFDTLRHDHPHLLMTSFAHMRSDVRRIGGDDVSRGDGIAVDLGRFVFDVGELQQLLVGAPLDVGDTAGL